jgi:hypothetical protein
MTPAWSHTLLALASLCNILVWNLFCIRCRAPTKPSRRDRPCVGWSDRQLNTACGHSVDGRMQGTMRLLRLLRRRAASRSSVCWRNVRSGPSSRPRLETHRRSNAVGSPSRLDSARRRRRASIKLGLLRVVATLCATEAIEYCIACVRDEHSRFYVDFMGLAPAGAPKVYLGLKGPMTLLVGTVGNGGARTAQALQSLRLKGDAARAWANDRPVTL